MSLIKTIEVAHEPTDPTYWKIINWPVDAQNDRLFINIRGWVSEASKTAKERFILEYTYTIENASTMFTDLIIDRTVLYTHIKTAGAIPAHPPTNEVEVEKTRDVWNPVTEQYEEETYSVWEDVPYNPLEGAIDA